MRWEATNKKATKLPYRHKIPPRLMQAPTIVIRFELSGRGEIIPGKPIYFRPRVRTLFITIGSGPTFWSDKTVEDRIDDDPHAFGRNCCANFRIDDSQFGSKACCGKTVGMLMLYHFNKDLFHTVDGRNPKANHLGYVKPCSSTSTG